MLSFMGWRIARMVPAVSIKVERRKRNGPHHAARCSWTQGLFWLRGGDAVAALGRFDRFALQMVQGLPQLEVFGAAKVVATLRRDRMLLGGCDRLRGGAGGCALSPPSGASAALA